MSNSTKEKGVMGGSRKATQKKGDRLNKSTQIQRYHGWIVAREEL